MDTDRSSTQRGTSLPGAALAAQMARQRVAQSHTEAGLPSSARGIAHSH